MKIGKRIALLAVSGVTITSMSANAQIAWGTGMAMGQQSCPYNVKAGEGASSEIEDYKDLLKARKDEEAKLREMKRKLNNLDKAITKNKETIEKTVDSKYTSEIESHVDNLRQCSDYKQYTVAKTGSEVSIEAPDNNGGDAPNENAQSDLTELVAFTPGQWSKVCLRGQKGGINGIVCDTKPYASADRGRSSPTDCKRALVELRKNTLDQQKTQDDIARSEDKISKYKDDIPEAKKRIREALRENTEGDVCIDCIVRNNSYTSERSSPDWAGVAANVGVGLLATYMGYQTNKMVAQYNSDLGWPTQAYPAWGYGLPFLANGLYGALGGGIGAGGFGCAGGMGGAGFGGGYMGGMGPFGMGPGMYGNMGMNGPFGYPNGMMGYPYGGGMFNGGMGPWGLGGLNGMGGFGLGGGLMMGGMAGGMMGMPMGGMMGMPMMGGMAGGMMGMPMGGMMGMPMGGMAGGMMGYPMGGLMISGGGMMGMPMGGMMGMPMGGMAGGMMGMPMGGMMGMPMGGIGYPMMGAAIGLGAGGMMGMPMMGGMGMDMSGGMMAGGLGSMQMQQAMMQMQQQQMQLYMQQYQQQMQSQMARQQTMVGLQSELYNLMYRIQQVQSGLGTTSYLGGGAGGYIGVGIGGGLGGGVNVPGVIPAPGNNGTGVINNGTGGGVIVPTSGR